MSNKGSEVISSNEGSVYVNGMLWTNVSKFEAKSTAEFDDVNFVGDPRTYKRYKGFKVEGSMTCKKTDSRVNILIANSIKTGDMPDIKIIVKQGTLGGRAERISLTGIVFSELQLASLEAGALIDEEMPFTAEDFEYLDRI